MTEINMKDYVDLRVNEQNERVKIALAAVDKKQEGTHANVVMMISISSILMSILNLVVLVMWHAK